VPGASVPANTHKGTSPTPPGLDLAAVLAVLAGCGITRLMVEGGPRVAAGLVRADLVDTAVLIHGAVTIGADGIDPLADLPLAALTASPALVQHGSEILGPDRLVRYERHGADPSP